MGTKQTTDSSTKFDPGSMSRYQGWQNMMFNGLGGGGTSGGPFGIGGQFPGSNSSLTGGGGLMGLWSNPTSSPFFNFNLQQQTKGASQLAGRNMSNALLGFNRSGIGAGSFGGGARASLLSGLNRFGSQMQFQGFGNAMNQANSDRWNAASLGSQLFQPLQTGGTTTQKTGGLGTWLPQVVGAGLGLASGFMGGGGGGMGSSFFSGANAAPRMPASPYFGFSGGTGPVSAPNIGNPLFPMPGSGG